MKCSQCDNEASAICQFCGRAVCADHSSNARFVSGFSSVGGWASATDNAVEVDDAVHCGICHPKYRRST